MNTPSSAVVICTTLVAAFPTARLFFVLLRMQTGLQPWSERRLTRLRYDALIAGGLGILLLWFLHAFYR